jgi:hypothetical protein
MSYRLQKPALLLAALLQLLPLIRNFVANPAVANSFAFILRWGIGAGAVLGSVDAVSGATSVFSTPSTFSGTVGTAFSANVTVSIGGGNQAASSDYFVVSSGSVSSSTLGNGQTTTLTMPPGLTFKSSWVNGANTIGGVITGTPTTAGTYPTTVTCVSPGNASLSQAITITIGGSTAPTAPAITTPPAAASVIAGKNASFTVTASGTGPLGYYWLKNGTALANGGNISGANSNVLSLAAVSATDAANYSVLVSNSVSTVTSAAAALTVILPPGISTQPAPQTQAVGASANFSVTATGSAPLAYRWLKNSVAVTNGTKFIGANSNLLTIATLATADAGNYSVIITNAAGSVTSSVAALTVVAAPTITTPPANASAVAGGSASFTVTASGSAPLAYQWLKAGSPLANGGNLAGATSATLTISSVSGADAASYSVIVSNSLGTATSAAATLTVAIPPAIVTAPGSATVLAGSNASFTVTASGTATLAYQWLKNGAAISGATTATLTLNNVSSTDAANYSVTVTNAVGTATSSAATLTVLVAPGITTQPASASVVQGNPASFSVTASGTAPLSFQWLKNGTPISGANSNILALAAVTTNDAANYSVVVTNVVGSLASSSATLTVVVPPTIVTQPASAAVVAGSNATFTVAATGTAPLTYQWLKNGVAISGATAATLTLNTVSATDAANYSATVANAAGTATSATATLTVNLPPAITTPPANQFGAAGSTINLSVVASGTGPLSYQWFNAGGALANAGNISGSATAALTITALTTNEVGNYFVVVSNAFGSVTSANASISINVAPSITGQPAGQTVTTGSNATFSVTANGSSTLVYQWFKNGSKLANGTGIAGATTATLALTSVTTNSAGSYTVTVTNLYGSATSAAAVLAVQVPPQITSQPASVSANPGTNVSFTVTATGTTPMSYQWLKNGSTLTDGGNVSGSTSNKLTLAGVTTNDAAIYSVTVGNPVGSVTSGNATLTVAPAAKAPVIVTQPASITAGVGAAANFSVTATGLALHYQWLKGASTIAGATSSTYTIASVKTTDAANYSVIVSNFAGSVTSAAASLTVAPVPVFVTQPTDHVATNNTTTVFKAKLKGRGTMKFQWFKDGATLSDGANISGSHTSSLTISNVKYSNAGAYALKVSNKAGSVTSSNALLTVVAAHHGGGGGGTDNFRLPQNPLKGNTTAKTVTAPAVANSVPAPVIAGISLNVDGSITLNCAGTAGSNYVAQASSDLKNWIPVCTNTVSAGGQWQVNDPAAAAAPARFYRLATP